MIYWARYYSNMGTKQYYDEIFFLHASSEYVFMNLTTYCVSFEIENAFIIYNDIQYLQL